AAWTMPSIISFVIHSNATGKSDESRRAASPNTTTAGAESHTILRTAGTFRRAERRSRHPVQKFCCLAIFEFLLFSSFEIFPNARWTTCGGGWCRLRKLSLPHRDDEMVIKVCRTTHLARCGALPIARSHPAGNADPIPTGPTQSHPARESASLEDLHHGWCRFPGDQCNSRSKCPAPQTQTQQLVTVYMGLW